MEESNESLGGDDTWQGKPIHSDVPTATTYCQSGSSDEEVGYDHVFSDHTRLIKQRRKVRERQDPREAASNEVEKTAALFYWMAELQKVQGTVVHSL